MLGKHFEAESNSVLSSQNVNSDVIDFEVIVNNLNLDDNKLNSLENNGGDFSKIQPDYQSLPQKYFKSDDIPPPLVLSKWLNSFIDFDGLNSDFENSDEDCIPLVQLKSKLKKSKKKSSKRNKQILENKEIPLINRKRGRPKKQLKDPVVDPVVFGNDKDSSADEEDFPNDFINIFNDSPQSDKNVNNEIKEEPVTLNLEDHDYYKPVNNSTSNGQEVVKENLEKEVNKEKVVIQKIKVDNVKSSFPCAECGKSFSAASTLKSHLRIHNNTLLKCTECQKGFTTKYLLKCHMRIHNGDLFMCHKCGKGFTTAELLKVHSRGHTGDRPFMCDICNKSFPSASNLSQHKLIHNSEKKFLCFQCGSSFSQKRCLDGHMLTHAEKNHICTVCGKLWARKSDLSEHMRVHTGVKPYCCSICPQKFTQASSLKRHQVVHMDAKPIYCSICSKSFKCEQYYKRHMRKHEKESQYSLDSIVKAVT